MTPGQQPDFPYTTKQVNRAGERIRRARTRGVDPADGDLRLLDEFRAAHYPTLREVHGRFTRLVHDKLGLEPVAPVRHGR